MTSEGISKADMPTTTTEHMTDDNNMPSSKVAGATGWAPEKRAAVEKKMKRKLDARCSLFVLIYVMNYLDRNNIAAAKLRGLEDDLNLSQVSRSTNVVVFLRISDSEPP
jgi:hypothetical protein